MKTIELVNAGRFATLSALYLSGTEYTMSNTLADDLLSRKSDQGVSYFSELSVEPAGDRKPETLVEDDPEVPVGEGLPDQAPDAESKPTGPEDAPIIPEPVIVSTAASSKDSDPTTATTSKAPAKGAAKGKTRTTKVKAKSAVAPSVDDVEV